MPSLVAMAKDRPVNLGQRATQVINEALARFLRSPESAEESSTSAKAKLPGEIATKLATVLALREASYRDGIIIQLAFGLKEPLLDLTKRPEGGRSVAQRLGSLFKASHIKGVADAYQNIAKNTNELCRGNQADFDDILRWANGVDPSTRAVAFEYVLASVALTARPVQPMPALRRGELTFISVSKLLDELMGIPSNGAHQQFSVAAFLHAVIDEFGMGGPGGLRVETKRINASDASSKTAGDIQILRGNRVEEAFEVTANEWSTKLDSARSAVREADLPRAHIIAAVSASFIDDAAKLEATNIDLSVIDVEALLRTLTAVMRKPAREAALMRLHDLLDRYQPDVDRVNAYVDLLRKHGLTA